MPGSTVLSRVNPTQTRYGADGAGGSDSLNYLRNFTQFPTAPASNSWNPGADYQYDLIESLGGSGGRAARPAPEDPGL